MLSGGVRRLINLWAVKPGERAVVFTANQEGDACIEDLRRVGVEIAAVVDARNGETIVSAEGKKRVRSVTLQSGEKVEADLVVIATGWTAPTSLLNMAGDKPEYDKGAARFFPTSLPSNVLATGGTLTSGDILFSVLLTISIVVGVSVSLFFLSGDGFFLGLPGLPLGLLSFCSTDFSPFDPGFTLPHFSTLFPGAADERASGAIS